MTDYLFIALLTVGASFVAYHRIRVRDIHHDGPAVPDAVIR